MDANSAHVGGGFAARAVHMQKTGHLAPFFFASACVQTENDEPQPQVVVAFGFLMTNCAPFRSSL